MKNMKKLLGLSLIVLSLTACSGSAKSAGVEYEESLKNQHYLVFTTTDNPEFAKMIVQEDDTWESLMMFFPAVPEYNGLTGVWTEPEGGVYQKDNLEVPVIPRYF